MTYGVISRWELLENCITQYGLADNNFTVYDVALKLACTVPEASACIQDHLRMQNQPSAPTVYVIYRSYGRTRGAVWHAGHRITDAWRVCMQTAEDINVRLNEIGRTLTRMSEIDPSIATEIRVLLTSLRIGSVQLSALINAASP